MNHLSPGQSVKYVTSQGETVDATITDIFVGDIENAHLAYGQKRFAIAKLSRSKEPNTFHFPEGVEPAFEPPQFEAPKPFTPGATASPDTPKPPGAVAP